VVKDIYNKIAENYDKDIFGIFHSTRELVSDQFQSFLPKVIESATDFAVGTGTIFLEMMSYFEIKQMYGNDISSGMLEIARKKIGPKLRTICDDLANIHSHVNDESQDLVLCHYVFSYCDLDSTVESAWRVLKPGGYCSIVTTTKKNFEELYLERFPLTSKLLNVNYWLESVYTPKNHEELLQRVTSKGLKVVESRQLKKEVTFRSYKDVKQWAYDSGWVASYFETYTYLKYFVTRMYFAISRVLFYPLYPVKASTDISIILLQKPLKD
jgi:ubiquinone/menaquinone biosynthesis C-methylase UbiE